MAKWQQIRVPVSYEVSTDGNIRHMKTGRVLRLLEDRDGYLFARFQIKKVNFKYPIHRLVALQFIPNPENKAEVNHKNGNKHDNRVENLEWMTRAENRAHAYATGLMDGLRGENARHSKLKAKQVRRIYVRYHKKNERITDLAKEHKVSVDTIRSIIYNKSWKHLKLKEKYGTKKIPQA